MNGSPKMLRKSILIAAALGIAIVGPAAASGDEPKHPHEPKGGWSFTGLLGKPDQAELQRGFKVYKEVCSSCHGMSLLSFRNLGEKHGPFYNAEYPNPNDNPVVKQIAADWQVQINDIDSETGDPIKRPATTADRFPDPYPNEVAAAAGNGGAPPPDLSVITKARHNGVNYVYSLLTGYVTPPAGLQVASTQHYNPYFPGDMTPFWSGDKKHVPQGGVLAMPPPLAPNKVTFDDGTASTVENQAKAVAAFLNWAAEPKQFERKQTGIAVMIYLILLSGLVYMSYRRVWRNQSH